MPLFLIFFLMTWLFFLARLLMVSLFFYSGYSKVVGFDAFVGMADGAGMPLPQFAIMAAIFMDFVGGLLLLVGKKFAGSGAALLIVFTIVASVFFHNFWAYTPGTPEYIAQVNNFMKNVAIVGGLMGFLWYYRYECPLFCALGLVEKVAPANTTKKVRV